MGKFINGINGPIQGKVGTVHGSSWKGIPYVKGPYKERTTKISAKESANRNKFKMAQAWLKPLLPFVREGFKKYTETVEGFIAAKSYLMANAMQGELEGIFINPNFVRVSHGTLPSSNNLAVKLASPGLLQFTWDTTPVLGGSPKDQVMLLAYDIEHGLADYQTTGQFRSTGADTLKIPAIPGTTYHVYAAFTAADRSSQSNSVYLGEIIL